jgi:hypothetical protein
LIACCAEPPNPFEIDPGGFMADAAGCNKLCIVRAFPKFDIENGYRECVFHLKQDVKRLGHNLPIENRVEHEALWDRWRLSSSSAEVEINTRNVIDFWRRYAPTLMSKLAGFIGFHMRHAGYVVEAYNEGESLMEAAVRPITNASEIMHATWKRLHGYGKPVEECVKWDLAFLIIQVHRGKVEGTQGRMMGTGPTLEMKIRAAMLKEEAKEYLSEAVRLMAKDTESASVKAHTTTNMPSAAGKNKTKVRKILSLVVEYVHSVVNNGLSAARIKEGLQK